VPVEAAAISCIGNRAIDIITQPVATRRKSLLVADMESTMIREEMLDELAELKGIRDEISAVTARAMNGELDFVQALHERVALLKGLPISALHDAWRKANLMPGARLLVATMRRSGGRAILVSGGFTLFTGKLQEMLEFDAHYGNELEFDRGVLTGGLVPPIRDRSDKLRVLQETMAAQGLTPDDVVAVGDGANDLPMLMAAGLGVAFHAKPSVRAAARYRIDHADLTALLYAQGYRRENFAP
jgi:phosphoserine phosphatase